MFGLCGGVCGATGCAGVVVELFEAGERAAAELVAAGGLVGVADGLGNCGGYPPYGGWLGEADGIGDCVEGADGLGAGELVAGVV